MTDDIIDLTNYLPQETGTELPRGAMSLWGADGERSRFALPLWRIIYLAKAERCVITATDRGAGAPPEAIVALDLAHEPARTDIVAPIPDFDPEREAAVVDRGGDGLYVYLGDRGGRCWCLVVDGGNRGDEPLPARAREDILFLAGECAGLLFFRDLAQEDGSPG